jgi:4-hydroxy-tetrahydrodipicolinate synthase
MFASPIDIETICRLAELPRIVGIKDSSGDISFMQRMVNEISPHRPDFAFLTGWEPALAPMLFVGATGGTLATAGVTPELTCAIFKAAARKDFDTAKKLQPKLIKLFDALLNAGEFPSGFRAGAQTRGFKVENSRQPHCRVSAEFEQRLPNMISAALAEQ